MLVLLALKIHMTMFFHITSKVTPTKSPIHSILNQANTSSA